MNIENWPYKATNEAARIVGLKACDDALKCACQRLQIAGHLPEGSTASINELDLGDGEQRWISNFEFRNGTERHKVSVFVGKEEDGSTVTYVGLQHEIMKLVQQGWIGPEIDTIDVYIGRETEMEP